MKARCLERQGAETQNWGRACSHAATRQGRAGQSHLKHSAWMLPFRRAGRTLFLFGLAFFLESSPNTEIFHLWKETGDSEMLPGIRSFTWQTRLHVWAVSCTKCPVSPVDKGAFMDIYITVQYDSCLRRWTRLPNNHYHILPRTIPPGLNVSEFWWFFFYYFFICIIIIIPGKAATSENKI